MARTCLRATCYQDCSEPGNRDRQDFHQSGIQPSIAPLTGGTLHGKHDLLTPARRLMQSQAVQLGEDIRQRNQWMNHKTIENRVEVAAVERPAVEPQLYRFWKQFLQCECLSVRSRPPMAECIW